MAHKPILEAEPAAAAPPRREYLDTPPARSAYAKRVWDLIASTYKEYGNSEDGNLYGAQIQNLVETPGVWTLLLDGDAIVAGVIYRKYKGNKVRLVLHDNTRRGKDALKELFIGEFEKEQCWGEFSGHLERILRERNVAAVPNTDAARILDKEIAALDPDGVHYQREVYPGTVKREMLFGHVEE